MEMSTARYRIEHTSQYRYDQEVSGSFNEARLTPQATRWQIPLESTLRIETATWQHPYVDYWGTQVRVFEVTRPHRELVVASRTLVEIDPDARTRPVSTASWDELRGAAVTEEFGELLAQTPRTEPPADLADLSRELAASHDPDGTARAISASIHDAMTYRPGSTGVYTPAAEAWTAREGVCQDYAHLVVGMLREVGIPARYVSGYLHPSKEPVIGEVVVGESHAWVEWWAGDWTAHDPTNMTDAADRHVIVGTGRDYEDVPPIKGIVAGTPVTTKLDVTVEITRLA